MNIRRPSLALFAAAAFAALGPAAGARAHGAVGYEQDACVLKIGPDFMYFTGYQPAVSHKKFCEDIPATGEAIFVLDYAQDEMREMSTAVRIVREAGGADEGEALDKNTVAYLPPKVYPKGTLNFEHIFSETGNFVGIVTVDGSHGEHWESRFPFSVGRAYSERTPYYLLTAAVVLAMLLFFWGRGDQKSDGAAR